MTLPEAGSAWPWRHRRVWLDPRAVEALSQRWQAGPQALDALAQWLQAGRPLVGRAWGPGEAVFSAGSVPFVPFVALGWAQPPLAQKRRLAFCVPRDAVLRSEPPLPLAQALPLLPAPHRLLAQRLLAETLALQVDTRVYGSAFWSHALGEPAMRESSDLDLLAAAPDRTAASEWLKVLGRCGEDTPVRLDGELLLAGGAAVAWRELAAAPASVLVKTDHGPRLQATAEVWETGWPAAKQQEKQQEEKQQEAAA